jgi:hypothetical protein
MVIRLAIDFGELVKVALKRGEGKVIGVWKKRDGASGFCHRVRLHVFLLL